MIAARWKALAMALAMLALHGDFAVRNGVMAEADCLGDGESCLTTLEACPLVCCSGVGMRTNARLRHCPQFSAVFGSAADNTPTAATSALSTDDDSHWEAIGSTTASSSEDNSAQASNGEDTTPTNAPSGSSKNATVVTSAPTPTPSTKSSDSVSAFDSKTGSVSRGGVGGATTPVIIVGALAGCIVLVAAVMYKRKTVNQKSLDAPNSSYRGSDGGSGLTPDNRSLVGMLDGGARATTDSMKQLPVLSMGSRDASMAARVSSPFGQGAARISSPANRGMTNEDYAFEVETSSRPGSSVQVAFVDVHHDTDVVPEKNGVVAL